MAKRDGKSFQTYAESEIGSIKKDWTDRTSVVLVYPNQYYIGMSNLGFQTVYDLLNRIPHLVCERAFLPDIPGSQSGKIRSIESGRLVTEFDVIAFSVSFENDHFNLLSFLEQAGLSLQAVARGDPHPFVLAGGVACLLNPETVAPYIDCFILGEADDLLPHFFDVFDRWAVLKEVSGFARKKRAV